ncbi:hypothetical protein OIU78_020452 [Salix suchowensis]|nr:hypothetical protein OIU78_020452 [Salix suchowensis]
MTTDTSTTVSYSGEKTQRPSSSPHSISSSPCPSPCPKSSRVKIPAGPGALNKEVKLPPRAPLPQPPASLPSHRHHQNVPENPDWLDVSESATVSPVTAARLTEVARLREITKGGRDVEGGESENSEGYKRSRKREREKLLQCSVMQA